MVASSRRGARFPTARRAVAMRRVRQTLDALVVDAGQPRPGTTPPVLRVFTGDVRRALRA